MWKVLTLTLWLMTTCRVIDRMWFVDPVFGSPCYRIGDRPNLIRQLSVWCVRQVLISGRLTLCGPVTVLAMVAPATVPKAMWSIRVFPPSVGVSVLCRR